jgi:phospholipid/cholesterol/gamma-HCH transport system substrate-binding protein
MAERTMKLRLGLFVAMGLAVLSGLIVYFGRAPRLFTNRVKYLVVFPEAPGLSAGTPVRKSGVRVGEVTTIDLDDESAQVLVNIEIDPRYLPRKGEEPVISRGLLNGDTSLDFVPQVNRAGEIVNRGEIEPIGSRLVGIPPISTRSLLSQAQQVVPTAQDSLIRLTASVQKFEAVAPKVELAFDEIAKLAKSGNEFLPELRQTNTKLQMLIGARPGDEKDKDQPLTLRDAIREVVELLKSFKPIAEEVRVVVKESGPEIKNTLASARKAADSVNVLLGPDNQKAITGTLKNVQTASEEIPKVIAKANTLADRAELTLKELQARLAQSEKVLNNIDKATGPIGEAVPEVVKNIGDITKNLAQTADQLTKTLAEAQLLIKKANSSDGTLNRVLTDPTLYNNVNDSVVSAMRVLLRIERIAKDLEVFADKVARKPETLGVGGAVRPSVGLKESPNAPLPQNPVMPIPATPSYPGTLTEPAGPIAPIPPIPLGVPVYKPSK